MTSGSAFLDRIIASKREAMASVGRDTRHHTRSAAVFLAGRKPHRHRFLESLQRDDRTNIIAEVKRSSPSAGAISQAADAVATARVYEQAGAAAISVLTEPEFFKGSMQDLIDVVANVSIPVLRKDFTVDRHQIYEAAAAGASAVLLIVAALDRAELDELRSVAEDELGLDALVEVHSEPELEIALSTRAMVIGVNNRNLQTLDVTLQTSRELARHIRTDKIFVSESGIKVHSDVADLKRHGYRAFLIGETLMRASDPSQALRSLATGAGQ